MAIWRRLLVAVSYMLGIIVLRIPAMATKRATTIDRAPRQAKKTGEEARFEAWLDDFDS